MDGWGWLRGDKRETWRKTSEWGREGRNPKTIPSGTRSRSKKLYNDRSRSRSREAHKASAAKAAQATPEIETEAETDIGDRRRRFGTRRGGSRAACSSGRKRAWAWAFRGGSSTAAALRPLVARLSPPVIPTGPTAPKSSILVQNLLLLQGLETTGRSTRTGRSATREKSCSICWPTQSGGISKGMPSKHTPAPATRCAS